MIELKINMDMPVSCERCPLMRKVLTRAWCGGVMYADNQIPDEEHKPEWCPLHEVKEESK